MHLSLPRKWRPRTFDALVGQEAVARTLVHAVESGRLHSAYLFTGPRGVGKTTTARLLAACLNCAKGPTPAPCGECASCTEIATRGESLDTIELDAASHNSVEDARELIEILRYSPQRDPRRIVILDEVHMLSKAAFNALLKTLEEPPPHATFILASTEIQKIPATIVSRCQRFSFRRPSEAEIEAHLRTVAAAEKIDASAQALVAIARAADGSLRDALSLLDQAATGGERVDEARCAELFAFVDRRLLESLFGAIASGDRAALLAETGRAREAGLDPRHGAREFLAFLREKLLAAAVPGKDAVPVGASYETLLRALSLALETERQLPRSADSWLVWEMSLMKMAELPRLRPIEEAISDARAGRAAPPLEGDRPRFVDLSPAVVPDRPAPAGPDLRGSFLENLGAKRAVVATYAALASSIREEGDELVLEFPIDKASARQFLDRPDIIPVLATAASEACGAMRAIRLVTGPPADGDLAAAAREVPTKVLSQERARNKAQDDPMVKKAMALFRGEVVEVKEEK
jgi:DNA polymerase-3 subunit gamma/tau